MGVRSGRTRTEHIVYVPLALLLTNGRVAQDPMLDEHVVRWLQDALEVGRVSLRQGKLFGELVEADAPGEPAVGASHLEQAIEPAGHRRLERPVRRRGEGDHVI